MTGERFEPDDFLDESSDEIDDGNYSNLLVSDVEPTLDIDTAFGFGPRAINYDNGELLD